MKNISNLEMCSIGEYELLTLWVSDEFLALNGDNPISLSYVDETGNTVLIQSDLEITGDGYVEITLENGLNGVKTNVAMFFLRRILRMNTDDAPMSFVISSTHEHNYVNGTCSVCGEEEGSESEGEGSGSEGEGSGSEGEGSGSEGEGSGEGEGSEGEGSEGEDSEEGGVQTGDESNPAIWFGLSIASLMSVIGIFLRKKRQAVK